MDIIPEESGDERRELELEISESDRFRFRAIVGTWGWAMKNAVGWKVDWKDVARIPILIGEPLE